MGVETGNVHITERKRIIQFSGLCCADCAAKIEKEAGAAAGVKTASLDFMAQKLVLEIADTADGDGIEKRIKEIARRIEPEIKFLPEKEAKEQNGAAGAESKTLLLRRIGFAVGVILFVLALCGPAAGIRVPLFLAAYLLVGSNVLLRALSNIADGRIFSEYFLMSIATIGAFAIGEYPEGVAVMLFYQIGEFFQGRAVNRSRKSIATLMDIRPDFANLKTGETIKVVAPEEIEVGDRILVKPGEKIPLDGVVVEGRSTLDTSALTGESLPREVEPGAEVLSGSINQNGVLTVEVSKRFGDSTVTKILDLVQNAGSRKAQLENFITKFARYYTPAVVLAALLLAFIPPLFVPGAAFSDWLKRALVFLVVSCPCALVISIPLSFFGGIGAASRSGILIKGGNYLEALNDVDTVVFDKTGTLTKGVFKVVEIVNFGRLSDQMLLKHAAAAESYSNHPIALSIRNAYGQEIDQSEIEDYEEISGYGIKAKSSGENILVGNTRLMEREGVCCEQAEAYGTAVHLAVNGSHAGYLTIADEVKQDSARAIRDLRAAGVKRIAMLTGDRRAVGDKIAREMGVDEAYTELLPAQKVEKLEELEREKSTKGKLVAVGDGINDAPLLARADIGVAMGGVGSDAAIEAADVVLMTDEPSKLVDAIKIAKRTHRIVWQNVIFALGVKAVILILGAMGIATMWEAVFGDVGVALIAVLNAMRVLKVKKEVTYG